MKGIIGKNSIKIIPEDSIEKRIFDIICSDKSFYIRSEGSIDFKVYIEQLEKLNKKKILRRLFKINNPNLIKRMKLKYKNWVVKIKNRSLNLKIKIQNRFDLNRKFNVLKGDYKRLIDDLVNSNFTMIKLKEQLTEKSIELASMEKVLTKKCDELVNERIKKTVDEIEQSLTKKYKE